MISTLKDMVIGRRFQIVVAILVLLFTACNEPIRFDPPDTYPAVWFMAINDPNKPDWEILPQE